MMSTHRRQRSRRSGNKSRSSSRNSSANTSPAARTREDGSTSTSAVPTATNGDAGSSALGTGLSYAAVAAAAASADDSVAHDASSSIMHPPSAALPSILGSPVHDASVEEPLKQQQQQTDSIDDVPQPRTPDHTQNGVTSAAADGVAAPSSSQRATYPQPVHVGPPAAIASSSSAALTTPNFHSRSAFPPLGAAATPGSASSSSDSPLPLAAAASAATSSNVLSSSSSPLFSPGQRSLSNNVSASPPVGSASPFAGLALRPAGRNMSSDASSSGIIAPPSLTAARPVDSLQFLKASSAIGILPGAGSLGAAAVQGAVSAANSRAGSRAGTRPTTPAASPMKARVAPSTGGSRDLTSISIPGVQGLSFPSPRSSPSSSRSKNGAAQQQDSASPRTPASGETSGTSGQRTHRVTASAPFADGGTLDSLLPASAADTSGSARRGIAETIVEDSPQRPNPALQANTEASAPRTVLDSVMRASSPLSDKAVIAPVHSESAPVPNETVSSPSPSPSASPAPAPALAAPRPRTPTSFAALDAASVLMSPPVLSDAPIEPSAVLAPVPVHPLPSLSSSSAPAEPHHEQQDVATSNGSTNIEIHEPSQLSPPPAMLSPLLPATSSDADTSVQPAPIVVSQPAVLPSVPAHDRISDLLREGSTAPSASPTSATAVSASAPAALSASSASQLQSLGAGLEDERRSDAGGSARNDAATSSEAEAAAVRALVAPQDALLPAQPSQTPWPASSDSSSTLLLVGAAVAVGLALWYHRNVIEERIRRALRR